MDSNTKKLIDLFLDNYTIMKKNFTWQNTMAQMMSAMIYSGYGRRVNPDNINNARKIIKKNTGLFSQFKGNTNLILSTYLSVEINQEDKFSRTLTVYNKMKKAGFKSSDYLVFAAYNIADQTEESEYDTVIERTANILSEMKKRHRIITGIDDYIYISMLSLFDEDVNYIVNKVEDLYSDIKKRFFSKNGVQGLSQVLALSGENKDQIISRTMRLYEKLKERKYDLKGKYLLPVLGVLTLTSIDPELLTVEIDEVYTFLKQQKGFGTLSMSKTERILFSVSVAAYSNVQGVLKGSIDSTINTSITNILIAQQAAIMAAASAAAAASSSASS